MIDITNMSPALPCDVCEAPMRRLPKDGTCTTFHFGLRMYYQFHRPGCPAGFQSRLPPEEDES